MPRTTPQKRGSATTQPLSPNNGMVVEAKEFWWDAWTPQIDIVPLACEKMVVSQGVGRLTLGYQYGPNIRKPFDADYVALPKPDASQGWWVRVLQYIDEVAYVLFVGRIESPQHDVDGDQQTPAGSSTPQAQGAMVYHAYGPARILHRTRMHRSHWMNTARQTYELGWLPAINMRHGSPDLAGNRSAEVTAPGTGGEEEPTVYAFGGTETWTSLQLAEHLLWLYVEKPARLNSTDIGPRWRVVGDRNYLSQIQPRLDLGSANNVLDVIRSLASPERGIDCHVRYWWEGANVESPDKEGFELDVFSLSDYPQVYETYATPANTRYQPFDVSTGKGYDVTIEEAVRERFDKLRITGDRVLTCFSVGSGVSSLVSAIEAGWSADEELAYLAGDTATANAKPEQHDLYRADPRFAFVFRKLVVPVYLTSFNFASGAANPVFTADGELDATAGATAFQRFELGTLPKLPLLAGVDYTQTTPTTRNPTNAIAEYLPPMVFAYSSRLSRWFSVTAPPEPSIPPVEVGALEHELGVLLRCNPGHVAASGYWEGAASSRLNPDANGWSWSNAVATLAYESDNRVSIEVEAPAELRSYDGAVKEVRNPNAQYWHLAPHTVVGVDRNGTLLRAPSAGTVIRDDRPILRAMAPGLMARYLVRRIRLRATRARAIEDWQIGDMLDLSGEQGFWLGTRVPVTAVSWSFPDAQTTLYGGHAEQ